MGPQGLGIEIIEQWLGIRADQLSTDAAGFNIPPPTYLWVCGSSAWIVSSRMVEG